jgi:hypothetical protein
VYKGPRDSRDRDREKSGVAAIALIGLALLIIGWLGVFFARLIQAAVSRQRELLADASSVQFTRNPAGLSGALQKIGRYSFGSHIESPQAEQASHMFFGNGISEPLFGLMATHPPITERIHAIDPAWDGKFPALAEDQIETVQRAAVADFERGTRPTLVGTLLAQAAQSPFGDQSEKPVRISATAPIAARAFTNRVATPTPAHLEYAEKFRNSVPETIRLAAGDSLGASSIIYSLLLSEDEQVRRKQLDELSGATSPGVAQETARLWPEFASIATHAKLPLVDLALPALRQLSAAQYQQFSRAIQRLIESDSQIDLFEYVLQKIVLRHLDPHFNGARKPVVQFYALRALAPDCAVLLSALAQLGQDEPQKVEAAFRQGAQPLSYAAQVEIDQVPAAQCDLSQVDAVLNRLSQAAPQIKKSVLDACAQTVAADGVIQEMEAELLRAVADTLDCPMPPFIPARS